MIQNLGARNLELVPVAAGGVRWHVVPECRDRLIGPDGLRLEEWLRSGQARVVKDGPHRTVYHVALPDLAFYLKHYRLMDARSWLRQLVRPAKARTEFERGLAVAARGVPTVVPLAWGEPCTGPGPQDSFLITRSLEGAEPLSGFIQDTFGRLEPCRQTALRQRLAVELGRLVARMHDAGVVHNDLHAANLLVRLEAGDRPSLYLIDLHTVHLTGPLGWPASRDNLVMLNRWFVLRVGRTDRLRFWKAYCKARRGRWEGGGGQPGHPAQGLERRTWASNLCFWRHRGRRCLATNRHYRRVRSPAAAGHAVRGLDGPALAALLEDPDRPFREPGAVLLKDSPSSTVAELDLPVNGVARRVIYKRFRVTAWSDPWVALVRRSAALRSWVHGHALLDQNLPTARPLAVLHRRRGGLDYEGYLLTEKIPDALDLHQYLSSLDSLPAPERRAAVRGRIDQVARLVRELHRRGLSHRDLKATNVLVSGGGNPAASLGLDLPKTTMDRERETPVWLIDLVGVTRYRKLPRHRRLQNLTRLHASFCRDPGITRTDKLRFLRVYLQWGLFGRAGWKSWWRAVEAATRVKVARNLRNGRPLA